MWPASLLILPFLHVSLILPFFVLCAQHPEASGTPSLPDHVQLFWNQHVQEPDWSTPWLTLWHSNNIIPWHRPWGPAQYFSGSPRKTPMIPREVQNVLSHRGAVRRV